MGAVAPSAGAAAAPSREAAEPKVNKNGNKQGGVGSAKTCRRNCEYGRFGLKYPIGLSKCPCNNKDKQAIKSACPSHCH